MRIVKTLPVVALTLVFSSQGLSDVTMKQKLTTVINGKTYPMESTIYFQGKSIRMDMKGGCYQCHRVDGQCQYPFK